MNVKLRQFISLIISVCLALSLVAVPAYAFDPSDPKYGNGDEGSNTSGVKGNGNQSTIMWNQFGYRVYIASGPTVVSPIYDIRLSDVPSYTKILYKGDNSRATILGGGTVAGYYTKKDNEAYFSEPMPYPSYYKGNTFYPNGNALRDWFMSGSGHYVKDENNKPIELTNLSEFINAYFKDFYDDFSNKEKNYKLVVETLSWPSPWDQNGKPYGRNIYGTVREIA